MPSGRCRRQGQEPATTGEKRTLMSRLASVALLGCLLLGCLVLPCSGADDTPSPQGTDPGPPSVVAPTARIPLTPAATLRHGLLDEISGIAASRSYPGTFWVHADSGAAPFLWAIRADGTVTLPSWRARRYYVGEPQGGKKPYPGLEVGAASSIDWEDIAVDDGTIYVADTGNNANARRDLGIYVIPEPNPDSAIQTRPLKWLPVAYPDQEAFPGNRREFDCEALFIFKKKPYLLTKHRQPGSDTPAPGTRLYRLDTAYTDRPNVLQAVDAQSNLGGWVTGADMSPDGRMLAVLCHAPVASVWLFEVPRQGDRLLSGPARRLILQGAGQCEAVTFSDSENLILVNENGQIFPIPLSRFPR